MNLRVSVKPAFMAMLKPYERSLRFCFARRSSTRAAVGRIVSESVLAYGFESKDLVSHSGRGMCSMRRSRRVAADREDPVRVGIRRPSDTAEPHAAGSRILHACRASHTPSRLTTIRSRHRIPKPPSYDRIRDSQPFGLRMNYPAEYGWRGAFQPTALFGEDPAIPNNMSPRPFFPCGGWWRIRTMRGRTRLRTWR